MQFRFLMPAWFLVLAIVLAAARAPADELKPEADDGDLGLGFHSEFAEANGIRLHYVEGGSGSAIVLIPGWPQSSGSKLSSRLEPSARSGDISRHLARCAGGLTKAET